jgi:hypothetical protein
MEKFEGCGKIILMLSSRKRISGYEVGDPRTLFNV